MLEFIKEDLGEIELIGWIQLKEDISHKIWQLIISDLDVQCLELVQKLTRKKEPEINLVYK